MLGTLEGIRDTIKQGLLVTVQNLVFAEAFADLLGQAQYLLTANYFLAAGVLGRAVLEEYLRRWCRNANCLPAKPKPTINDFKAALQQGGNVTAIEVKHIDAMASIGNAAAHNQPGLSQPDVERLIRDVEAFLASHPL
jgi:hypothetical protein